MLSEFQRHRKATSIRQDISYLSSYFGRPQAQDKNAGPRRTIVSGTHCGTHEASVPALRFSSGNPGQPRKNRRESRRAHKRANVWITPSDPSISQLGGLGLCGAATTLLTDGRYTFSPLRSGVCFLQGSVVAPIVHLPHAVMGGGSLGGLGVD